MDDLYDIEKILEDESQETSPEEDAQEVSIIGEKFSELFSDFLLEDMKAKLVEIDSTWNDIGFCQEHRANRCESIRISIVSILSEVFNKEIDFRDRLNEFHTYTLLEVNKILKDLSLAPFVENQDLSLLKKNRVLLQKRKELQEIKERRLTKLEAAVNKSKKICAQLGIEFVYPVFETDIPNDFELTMVRSNVISSEEKLGKRKIDYAKQNSRIQELVKQLEYELTEEEENLLDIKHVVYSDSTMDGLEKLGHKLEKEISKSLERQKSMQEKLAKLYERLGTEAHVQDAFTATLTGSHRYNEGLLEHQVKKFEILKLSAMKSITLKTREDIKVLLDQIRADEFELPIFFQEEDFTEALLDLHEEFYDALKEYFVCFEPVFTAFSNYEETMEKALALEVKLQDPNKYKSNRGGALLNNDRDYKLQRKRMDQLETAVRTSVINIESTKGISFGHFGMDVERYFQDMKMSYENEVENIKTSFGKGKSNSNDKISAGSLQATASVVIKRLAPTPGSRTPFTTVQQPTPIAAGSNFNRRTPGVNSGAKINTTTRPAVKSTTTADPTELMFKRGLEALSTQKAINSTVIVDDFALPKVRMGQKSKRRLSRSLERAATPLKSNIPSMRARPKDDSELFTKRRR